VNIRFLLTPIILFFSTAVSAQLLIGPEAGANLSWTTFNDKDLKNEYSIKPVIGYNAGVHVGFRVQKRFFLHLSLIYSTKGRIIKEPSQDLRNKTRYNYIEMPIIYTIDFKGKIGGNKEFKYNLGVGPTVSYWLGGKGIIENRDTDEFSTGKVPYKIALGKDPYEATENEMAVTDFNRVQLGLNITGSIIFEPAPSRQIMLTLRYEVGHSFLARNDGAFKSTIYQDPLQSRNKGFRLSVAYLFDTKLDQRKRGKSTKDVKKKR